ncbi:hypothetical protein J7L49_02085 [Candidatus Bathyarchaeota archaeon]|nr:hypothetical protein [Candidatus Bathyarchaeota archaeon]
MKRLFADLHLFPNFKNFEQIKRLIEKASEFGYRLIGIPLPQSYPKERIEKLRGFCRELGIDFTSRLDLKPLTTKELLKSLRKFRRKFELIAVLCTSKNIARQAAKDHRVDLLNFPLTDPRKRFFDKAEAELASNASASLEIDIKPLITLKGFTRIKFISTLRREFTVAKSFQVPIVVSSGASNELLMRKPREIVSLTSLFDMDKNSALKAITENPFKIVTKNREKLKPSFVAPGIRVVRKGKDC